MKKKLFFLHCVIFTSGKHLTKNASGKHLKNVWFGRLLFYLLHAVHYGRDLIKLHEKLQISCLHTL